MEPDRRIRRIAIVGGGIAGWTAAVALARRLGGQCSIHVVESAEAMAPGFAQATLPPALEVLRFLGIDQNDFVDKTQATYGLATRFAGWAAPDTAFWHAFGVVGALIERRPFYHFWHKARSLALTPRIEHYSTELTMALAGRFIFPTNSLGVATNLRYGLHFDVALATRYLRTLAERAGVIRLERKVVSATRSENGFIDELQFEDGGKLRADLFIDNTGSRAQLIGETLESAYEDWTHWLPCDRMLCAPAALEDSRPPCVRIEARTAGWQWRIPLQQSLSIGAVYASTHQSDADAARELAGAALEPRRFDFTAGVRRKAWDKNVVALGSAAGFLEPLVATDLHLLSNSLFNLLDHFPDKQFDPANMASYNALIAQEFEHIRDFILLHYALARRDDSPFWRHWSGAQLPDTLAQRIAVYRGTGRINVAPREVFNDLDWFWVFEGVGVVPRDYDPLVDTVDFEQVKRLMLAISQKVAADVATAPTHDSFFAAANARLGNARRVAAAAPAGAAAPSNVPAQSAG